MEKRKFILMRNPVYAKTISEKRGYIVRETESELLGVIPKMGDCFIIDAHYSGRYVDLEGLKIAVKLVDFISDITLQIELWSWLPEKYIREHYHFFNYYSKHNVSFKQFPDLNSVQND